MQKIPNREFAPQNSGTLPLARPQTTRLSAVVANLLTRRAFVASDRRFTGQSLTGFGGFA